MPMPEIQFDQQIRYVSLNNLRAMCERVSGVMCHKYSIEKVTERFVYVHYSNENEYARAEPMIALFPVLWDGWDNGGVIMRIHRVMFDNWHGEGWQAFQVLLDCPELFRGPNGEWQTREEIEGKKTAE